MATFTHKVLKFYSLWFLIFTLLIAGISWIFIISEQRHHIKEFQLYDKQGIESIRVLLKENFASAAKQLLLIRHLMESNDFFLNEPSITANHFKEIMDNNETYMQLRFVDQSGLEKIKVIQDQMSALILPDHLLQNKADRYYIKDSQNLTHNQLFYSIIDLNIENKKIEFPHNPTMRLVIKLFRSGVQDIGYLVLNLSLRNTLSFLANHVSLMGSSIIVDEKGFFIKGIHEADCWGDQLSDRKNKNIKLMMPNLWAATQTQSEGLIKEKDNWILFITYKPFNDDAYTALGGNEKLIIASVFTRQQSQTRLRDNIRRIILLSLIAAIIAAFIIYLIAKAQIAKGEAFSAVQNQNKTLIELDRAKDTFFSIVTHELRTPLTSIKGFVLLFLQKKLGTITEQQREALETVNIDCGRMLQLVNDLLDVGKMASGRFEIVLTPCNLCAVVKQSVTSINSLVLEKGITVQICFSDDQLILPLDADRFQQSLVNLLGNCIKFAPKNSSIDICQCHPTPEDQLVFPETASPILDHPYVWLTIKDQGPGLTEEALPHIFDNYFQAKQSGAQKSKGTGLGLGIAQGIIENHGGFIWVESKGLGHGVVFNILLPKQFTFISKNSPQS